MRIFESISNLHKKTILFFFSFLVPCTENSWLDAARAELQRKLDMYVSLFIRECNQKKKGDFLIRCFIFFSIYK